jgi:hypothetical protein
MDRLIYDTPGAYNCGIRRHPQIQVISLGMKIMSYKFVSIADVVIIEVEKASENLPKYIRIENK